MRLICSPKRRLLPHIFAVHMQITNLLHGQKNTDDVILQLPGGRLASHLCDITREKLAGEATHRIYQTDR